MKPRILLLRGKEDEFTLEKLSRDATSFSFVPFEEELTEETVERYLQEHSEEFDAIAVFSHSIYGNVREAMEAVFDGPKILFHTGPKKYRYKPKPGQYMMEVTLSILPSEFDRRVEKNFRDL